MSAFDSIKTSLGVQTPAAPASAFSSVKQAVAAPTDEATQTKSAFDAIKTNLNAPPAPSIGSKITSFLLPSTTQDLQSIGVDPLSLKANPLNALKDAFNGIAKPIEAEYQNIKDLFDTTKTADFSGKVATTLKALGGAANVALSPITALFSAANDIPVLGTAVKIISLPFSFTGDVGSDLAKGFVEKLPISQDAKDKISPALQEIGQLAGQIALGGKILDTTMDTLKAKFGATDAQTIVDQAQAKADAIKSSEAAPAPELPQTELPKAPETTPEAVKQPIESVSRETSVPQVEIPKELQPLAEEAKKYNSANDFIKSQGKPIYHGTDIPDTIEKQGFKKMPIKTGVSAFGEGSYLTTSKADAKGYGGIVEAYLPKDINLKKVSDADAYTIDTKQLIKEGYDGVELDTGKGKNITVFDPTKIQTKSQLTDIWNKATAKETSLPEKTPSVKQGEGEKARSKVGVSVAQKAIENQLIKDFGKTAEYTKIEIKDQAARVADLIANDLDRARRILAGKEALPDGMRGGMLIKGLEDYATDHADGKLISEIKRSPLVAETSIYAQELRTLAERNPESAVAKMDEVQKSREAAVEKKTGQKISELRIQEKAKLKDEIKKQVEKKQPWDEFIDSIQCGY